MPSALKEYFADREAALLADARAARVFSSSTGLGRAREHFVSGLLSDHLPSRLVAARGELIDSFGRRSGEVDCVLVDHDSSAYRLGGEVLVPIEAANAVLEIKSSLAGDELAGAIRKIARVKALTRAPHNGWSWYSDEVTPRVPVPPVHAHGYVVAYDAPEWGTILTNLSANPAWYENDWMRFGPEIICVLARGFIFKNDHHYWLPMEEDQRALDIIRSSDSGAQSILEHIQTTVTRYGALTYDLSGYNA